MTTQEIAELVRWFRDLFASRTGSMNPVGGNEDEDEDE